MSVFSLGFRGLGENLKLVGYIGAHTTRFHGVTYTHIICLNNTCSQLLNPCLARDPADPIIPPVLSWRALPRLSIGNSEGSNPDWPPVSETGDKNSNNCVSWSKSYAFSEYKWPMVHIHMWLDFLKGVKLLLLKNRLYDKLTDRGFVL